MYKKVTRIIIKLIKAVKIKKHLKKLKYYKKFKENTKMLNKLIITKNYNVYYKLY